MTKPKHSPLPWKDYGHEIQDADDNIIEHYCEGGVMQVDRAFIVRACNAHEKLVGALKLLFEEVNDPSRCFDEAKDFKRRHALSHPCLALVREALALAEK